jgi:hypothetical protein
MYLGFSGVAKVAATVSGDLPSIAAGATGTVALTVPGLKTDMIPIVHSAALTSGLFIAGAVCDTNGTLDIYVTNTTGGPVDEGAKNFDIVAL